MTDNYYKVDKSVIKKYCSILLIDDINTSRIFISEKNMYYIRYDNDDDDCDESDFKTLLIFFHQTIIFLIFFMFLFIFIRHIVIFILLIFSFLYFFSSSDKFLYLSLVCSLNNYLLFS